MIKKFIVAFSCLLVLFSCKESTNDPQEVVSPENKEISSTYISAGEKITPENALSEFKMQEYYQNMEVGDSLGIKFIAEVNQVCKEKGCWVKLDLDNDREVMVKFKDYGFFVPKDIEDKKMVVEGKAFISMVSVEEQKHFAEDAGKTSEEIAVITEPKKTLSFLADGVLIMEENWNEK